MIAVRLSIGNIKSPADYPSREKIEEVFKLIEEMGLDENIFDDEGFAVKIYPLKKGDERIILEGAYRRVSTSDRAIDVDRLSISIYTFEGKRMARFGIYNYSEYMLATHETASYDTKVVAYIGPELIPWNQFVPLIKKAQGLGALPKEVKTCWWVYKGWSDLGPVVRRPKIGADL